MLKIEFIIVVPQYTPPATFLSLFIALSNPEPENQGFSFPLLTICHSGLKLFFLNIFLIIFHSLCPPLLFFSSDHYYPQQTDLAS